MVSGLQLSTYWTTNYIVDFAKYLIPGAFVFGMLKALDVKVFTEDTESYLAVMCLLLFFGLAIIPFSYFYGFAFKSHGAA